MSSYALGVDVGATKVAIARIGDDLKVRRKIEVSTKCGDGNELWASIAEVASDFIAS